MRARVRKSVGLPPWPSIAAATLPKGARVVSPFGSDDWRAALLKAAADDVVVLDAPTGVTIDDILGAAAGRLLLVGVDDCDHARAATSAAGLSLFKVAGAPDRLFACSYPLDERLVTLRAIEKLAVPVEQLLADVDAAIDLDVRVIKADTSNDERLVYGVVLEPDGVDSQNDTISADEIRQAAHRFMQEFANVGLQHQAFINGKARILESFIAPVDFALEGQGIRKGTWLMAMRVVDDDIWTAVKAGKITGFSIGGSAIREPA